MTCIVLESTTATNRSPIGCSALSAWNRFRITSGSFGNGLRVICLKLRDIIDCILAHCSRSAVIHKIFDRNNGVQHRDRKNEYSARQPNHANGADAVGTGKLRYSLITEYPCRDQRYDERQKYKQPALEKMPRVRLRKIGPVSPSNYVEGRANRGRRYKQEFARYDKSGEIIRRRFGNGDPNEY